MLAKVGIATFAAIVFFPVLIAAGISGAVSAVVGDSTSSLGCTLTGDQAAVAGYGPDQLANAATIVAVGKQMNVSEQGWVVAIAAAMQESGLRNLGYGDRDSLGLFQQRPSQGWGSPAQIMNPAYAATQFYQHLLAVPGWQQMSVATAAQAVQRSAFPDAYAKHEQAAHLIVAMVRGGNCVATNNSSELGRLDLYSAARLRTLPPDGVSNTGCRPNRTQVGADVASVWLHPLLCWTGTPSGGGTAQSPIGGRHGIEPSCPRVRCGDQLPRLVGRAVPARPRRPPTGSRWTPRH